MGDSTPAKFRCVDLEPRKAKVMSGLFGVRETVTSVPATLVLQLVDPVVKDSTKIGKGVEYYDNEEFRLTEEEEETSDENANSVSIFNAVDGEGRTVAVRVTAVPFFVFVQCPDNFDESHMKRIARHFELKYSLRSGDVGVLRKQRHHFCYWKPDPKDPRKTRLYNYCVLSFPHVRFMRWASSSLARGVRIDGLGERSYPVHETRMEPVQKMLLVMDITPSGWFEVSKWRVPERYFTHSQIEVEADWRDIKDRPEIDEIAPFWKCAWDIECYSADGSFPDPEKNEDITICINSYFKQHGRNRVIHTSHHFGEVTKPQGVHVFKCDTELETIERWRDLITLDIQPTVMEGYNVDGFDWNWLARKATGLAARGTLPRLFKSGVIIDEVTKMKQKELNSNAKGDNTLSFIPMTGRLLIDMFHIIKADHKLDSYELKDVCVNFFGIPAEDMEIKPKGRILTALLANVGKPVSAEQLIKVANDKRVSDPGCLKAIIGELKLDHGYQVVSSEERSTLGPGEYVLCSDVSDLRKIDLPHHKIWENYDGGPETRMQNVIYCARDCEMPMKLEEKLQVLTSLVEMSKITHTPLPRMLVGGQQIKTWNQIVYYCHKFDCVVNLDVADTSTEATEGYEGAIVLDPLCGYYDVPIATLDFASLYPSIMQGNNICYSTLVKDAGTKQMLGALCKEEREKRHEVIDKVGDKYSNGVLRDGGSGVTLSKLYKGDGISYREIYPIATKANTFVQHFEGVVPRILSKLKARRKAVKAEQKNFPYGSIQWFTLECRQFNLKVTANSVYGFFGAASRGILPCVEISESVTCFGREMILETKAYVENDFAIYTSNDFVDSINGNIQDARFHHSYIPKEIKDSVTGVTVIYGDTDSVMIWTKGLTKDKDGVKWCHKIGKLSSTYITGKFKKHPKDEDIVLEYEKCYFPYLLIGKKRYAGYIWTGYDYPDKRDAKGVDTKRRDKWLGLRKTFGDCLNAMLDWRKVDLELAKRLVLNLLDDIVNDRLPISAYVSSKSLKKDYSKSKSLPPHVVVRDKKKERRPGSEPKSGNRVPFVITGEGGRKAVGARADDPEYVEQSGGTVKIDRLYYIESLKTPFTTLFESCFENPEKLFEDAINQINKKRKGLQDITSWCVKKPRIAGKNDAARVQEVDRAAEIMKSVRKRDEGQYVPKAIQKENKKKRKLQEAARQPMKAFLVPKVRGSNV